MKISDSQAIILLPSLSCASIASNTQAVTSTLRSGLSEKKRSPRQDFSAHPSYTSPAESPPQPRGSRRPERPRSRGLTQRPLPRAPPPLPRLGEGTGAPRRGREDEDGFPLAPGGEGRRRKKRCPGEEGFRGNFCRETRRSAATSSQGEITAVPGAAPSADAMPRAHGQHHTHHHHHHDHHHHQHYYY
nr:protein naked cuticle homolog 2-like [Columba livia]